MSHVRKTELLLAVLLAMVAARGTGAADVEVIQGFVVPEYDRDGTLKSELVGERAEIMEDNRIRVINLTIKFYSHGEVSMRVSAPECIYDRKHKVARSEGPVRIALKNMVVTGKGFRWSQGKERLEIFSNSRVVLKGLSSGVIKGEEQ